MRWIACGSSLNKCTVRRDKEIQSVMTTLCLEWIGSFWALHMHFGSVKSEESRVKTLMVIMSVAPRVSTRERCVLEHRLPPIWVLAVLSNQCQERSNPEVLDIVRPLKRLLLLNNERWALKTMHQEQK